MKSPFQQFIAAVKELRDSLLDIPKKLSAVDQDLKEQTKAIHEVRDAYKENRESAPTIQANLQVPRPLQIEIQPKDRKTVEKLTLLFVIAYTVITAFIFCETRKSAEAAKTTADFLKAQTRPWVAPTTHGLDPSDLYGWIRSQNPRKLQAWIEVNDIGKSPALHTATIAEWFADTLDAQYHPRFPKECLSEAAPAMFDNRPVREITLFPSDTQYGRGLSADAWSNTDVALSDSDLSEIRVKTKTLYMVGCSFYTDGAGDLYKTKFCMFYTPDEKLRKHSARDPWGYFDPPVYGLCGNGNKTEHKDENGQYTPD